MIMNNIKISKHRISGGFNPSHYSYVEQFDHRINEVQDIHGGSYGEAHDPLDSYYIEKLEANGYDCDHCTHCGAALKSGYVFLHQPSGEHIVMGNTCRERMGFDDADEIKKAHRENRLRLARLRALMKRNWRWKIVGEFLMENEDKHYIISDLLTKLNKYFSLSRRQIAFARSLVEGEERKQKIKAQREAKLATVSDWEDGRYEVSGTVISMKSQESDWGLTWKMLVELEDGKRAWGTVPSKFEGDRNDPIKFTATFTKSKDDPKFSFFSRPSIKK